MDCYDELYARAQRTADQERQRLELKAINNQNDAAVHSNSELSILASSMFNSIDGIQSSQSIGNALGNVEISETGQTRAETSP
jgi:hypothetical protein